jgi:hypothetical protein
LAARQSRQKTEEANKKRERRREKRIRRGKGEEGNKRWQKGKGQFQREQAKWLRNGKIFRRKWQITEGTGTLVGQKGVEEEKEKGKGKSQSEEKLGKLEIKLCCHCKFIRMVPLVSPPLEKFPREK